jgi:hypothetical protein
MGIIPDMDEANKKGEGFSDSEKEALKFLERDFNQAYQQMRHYDGQMFDLFKSAFVGYTTVIGLSVGLFQFSIKEKGAVVEPVLAILCVGLLFGFFTLALATRNRVYFVQMARFLNEQRALFFKFRPLGFSNRSGMYTNPKRPTFFNWRSSQAWYSYLICGLNGAMVGLVLHILFKQLIPIWIAGLSLCVFVLQLSIAVAYLVSRERKSGHEAVFGDKESPFLPT